MLSSCVTGRWIGHSWRLDPELLEVLRQLGQDILGLAFGELTLEGREHRHREPLGLTRRGQASLPAHAIQELGTVELGRLAVQPLARGPDRLERDRQLGRDLVGPPWGSVGPATSGGPPRSPFERPQARPPRSVRRPGGRRSAHPFPCTSLIPLSLNRDAAPAGRPCRSRGESLVLCRLAKDTPGGQPGELPRAPFPPVQTSKDVTHHRAAASPRAVRVGRSATRGDHPTAILRFAIAIHPAPPCLPDVRLLGAPWR